MTQRRAQLEARRQELVLRSQHLRMELAADQRLMAAALSGVERALEVVKRLARPTLLVGGAVLLVRLLRRRRVPSASRAIRPASLATRSLAFVSLVRRAISVIGVIRALAAARRQRQVESQF